MTQQADLVLLEYDHPLILVEVKSRPVRADFEAVVLTQLRTLGEMSDSTWLILAEPHRTRVYRRNGAVRHVADVPTDEVLELAGVDRGGVLGENVMLVAIEQWLHGLPEDGEFLERHPEVAPLAADVRRVTDSAWEFAVG